MGYRAKLDSHPLNIEDKFFGEKRPERESEHLLPPSVEVKNAFGLLWRAEGTTLFSP